MDTKIVVAGVASVMILAGGALVLARMSGQEGVQLAEASGTARAKAGPDLAAQEPSSNTPVIIIDDRDTPATDSSASGGRDRRNARDGFQRDGGQFRSPQDWRAEMLARFDKDGDGELSEEERQAAREAMRAEREQRRQQFLLERYDKDGDGVLNEAETKAMEEDQARIEAEREARRAEMQQRALEAYDTDGDGQLSEEERRAANQQRREWFQQQQQVAMARFDADGDGDLNQDERATMWETMRRAFDDFRFADRFDATGDGVVTAADMPAFLDLFYSGDPSADVNRDGVLDEMDLADFQQRVLDGVNPDVLAIREAFQNAPPPVDGEGGRGPGGPDGGGRFFGPGGGPGGPGGRGGVGGGGRGG